MKVALHACCGPCLLEPYDALKAEGHEIVVVYANPNIQPLEEYERRRDVLLTYAAEQGIEVVQTAYEPERWSEAVADVLGDPAERCRRCYRLRMKLTADEAESRGCDALATTLTVSPFQRPDVIAEEAATVARAAGMRYAGHDFRERYADAVRRSQDLGMYRQNYCGCAPSEDEARESRAARKRRRAGAAE